MSVQTILGDNYASLYYIGDFIEQDILDRLSHEVRLDSNLNRTILYI